MRSLKRAGHPEQAIAEALERLRRSRALDDGRFAEVFARSRLTHYGQGRNRIRAALRQRGVSRETAEQGLQDALRERPEQATLDAVAARLLRQAKDSDPRKRLARVFAALLRRGFPASLVRERLAVLRPGSRDMLEEYEVAALDPSVESDGDAE